MEKPMPKSGMWFARAVGHSGRDGSWECRDRSHVREGGSREVGPRTSFARALPVRPIRVADLRNGAAIGQFTSSYDCNHADMARPLMSASDTDVVEALSAKSG